MTASPPPYTVFVMLRALPSWLRLARTERAAIGSAALGDALREGTVRLRHFDAEAFSSVCSDLSVFETHDLRDFYRVMERLRDTPLFTHPHFELVQIIPAIEDGYRHFEQSGA